MGDERRHWHGLGETLEEIGPALFEQFIGRRQTGSDQCNIAYLRIVKEIACVVETVGYPGSMGLWKVVLAVWPWVYAAQGKECHRFYYQVQGAPSTPMPPSK